MFVGALRRADFPSADSMSMVGLPLASSRSIWLEYFPAGAALELLAAGLPGIASIVGGEEDARSNWSCRWRRR